ncbi:MAG: hypothetical protein LUE31_02280, partial [Lachnospiraceae bacterium]|nr:hypothetical protein [Lachnospiraceae bacterium]
EKIIAVIDKFMTVFLIFCYIMWGIIITTGLHLQVATNEGGTYLRIMGPETTFVVALYAIYSIYRDLRYRYALSIRTLMAILAVILVQQRTVWVCTAVGLILMLFGMLISRNKDSETNGLYNKGLTISSKLLQQLIFLSVMLVVIVRFGSGGGILGDLSNSYSSFSNLEEGTFGYRLALWSAHLSTLNGIEKVIGKSFGAGYLVSSSEVMTRNITPHNGYVHTADSRIIVLITV